MTSDHVRKVLKPAFTANSAPLDAVRTKVRSAAFVEAREGFVPIPKPMSRGTGG
jgi:hypothetical protein